MFHRFHCNNHKNVAFLTPTNRLARTRVNQNDERCRFGQFAKSPQKP